MIIGKIIINNNLDINLNSTVPLDSINYKSNQHRESFPYELDKIQPKMLTAGRHGDDGDEGAGDDDDPDEAQLDDDDDGDDFPSPEGISMVDFCLPESFLSLCVFRPAEAVESICDPPWVLGFRGDDIRERALAEVG
jgi:hypothetical protein